MIHPMGANLLALLCITAGILGLISAYYEWSGDPNAPSFVRTIQNKVNITALWSFILSILLTLLGVGLWHMERWAWSLATITTLTGAIGSLVTANAGTFFISVFIFLYLLHARKDFEIHERSREDKNAWANALKKPYE
ncbi:MAG: hypothetical protein JW778_01015 [Candidatus Altiarchaeota archaeon]|nr:hypothetical protein [Candidatus Altiarchaeota archaeon]